MAVRPVLEGHLNSSPTDVLGSMPKRTGAFRKRADGIAASVSDSGAWLRAYSSGLLMMSDTMKPWDSMLCEDRFTGDGHGREELRLLRAGRFVPVNSATPHPRCVSETSVASSSRDVLALPPGSREERAHPRCQGYRLMGHGSSHIGVGTENPTRTGRGSYRRWWLAQRSRCSSCPGGKRLLSDVSNGISDCGWKEIKERLGEEERRRSRELITSVLRTIPSSAMNVLEAALPTQLVFT